jgi:hypothetical protein
MVLVQMVPEAHHKVQILMQLVVEQVVQAEVLEQLDNIYTVVQVEHSVEDTVVLNQKDKTVQVELAQ